MTVYKGYVFEYHHNFKKEFNKIFKKKQCPTVKTDFKLLYDILINQLEERNTFLPHICMHMSGLEDYVELPGFIIKRFRCKGIPKGANSGFRITFLFDIEESKFIFVEIFNKNKKPVPDKNRINELFKKEVKIYDELYEGESSFLNS